MSNKSIIFVLLATLLFAVPLRAGEPMPPPAETEKDAPAPLKNPVSFVFVCTDENDVPLKGKTLNVTVTSSHPYDPNAEYVPPLEITKNEVLGDDGKLSLEPFEGNEITIKAAVDGYASIGTNSLRFQPGEYVIPLTFKPGGTVRGVVVDTTNNNAPVPNANINIGNKNVQTDENGRFELKDVPSGKKWMSVWANKMEPLDSDNRVTVQSGKVVELTIKMAPPEKNICGLKCTILKPDGTPLGGTPVKIKTEFIEEDEVNRHSPYHSSRGPNTTDGNGLLSYEGIQQGKQKISLRISGYEPAYLGEHEFKTGEIWEINEPVKLSKGLDITVVVKDAADKPLEGARIVVQPVSDGKRYLDGFELFGPEQPEQHTGGRPDDMPEMPPAPEQPLPEGVVVTDDKGTAGPGGLAEGKIAVLAAKRGYLVSKCKTVVLKKDAKTKVEFTLIAEATAAVQVVDADTKKTIPNSGVQRWQADTSDSGIIKIDYSARYQPSDTGTKVVRGLGTGKNYIVAVANGYASDYFAGEFKPGENRQLTIPLKKFGNGALTGTVKSPEKVDFVVLSNEGFGMSFGRSSGLVLSILPDGTFSVPELIEGRRTITLLGRDDVVLASTRVNIEKGKTADATLQLSVMGGLEITLLNRDGTPRANAELMIFSRGSGLGFMFFGGTGIFEADFSSSPFTTDETGKCSAKNLTPGEYTVRTMDSKRFPSGGQMWKATVEADKTTNVSFGAAGTTTVEGHITPEYDSPVDVVLFPVVDDIMEMMMLTFAEKKNVKPGETFTLKDVPPGKYYLAAAESSSSKKMMTSFFAEIEVKEGVPVKNIELTFPKKTQKVSGKIVGYRPGTHTRDSIFLFGKNLSAAEIRPDGTFETMAAPGKYAVHFFGAWSMFFGGGDNKLIEIVVEEGKDLVGVEIQMPK